MFRKGLFWVYVATAVGLVTLGYMMMAQLTMAAMTGGVQ